MEDLSLPALCVLEGLGQKVWLLKKVQLSQSFRLGVTPVSGVVSL